MARSTRRSKRKYTGGKYHKDRKKKQRELARVTNYVSIGKRAIKIKRTLGGNRKVTLLRQDFVNAYDPKTKKYLKLKIESVEENLANKGFERSNIITKGAIVKTEKGRVKVTSRPGQHGVINGVLLEE